MNSQLFCVYVCTFCISLLLNALLRKGVCVSWPLNRYIFAGFVSPQYRIPQAQVSRYFSTSRSAGLPFTVLQRAFVSVRADLCKPCLLAFHVPRPLVSVLLRSEDTWPPPAVPSDGAAQRPGPQSHAPPGREVGPSWLLPRPH